MYTLFGHEGKTTAANFSPAGDYFLTGGQDGVVLLWDSAMNPVKTEKLDDMTSRVETEVFVTQKERVDKIPETRATKVGHSPQKNQQSLIQSSP